MNPNEILSRSRALAEVVLRESLAELAHEAENGLDRARVARFSSLAVEANELLTAKISPPREPKTPKAPKAKAKKKPTRKVTSDTSASKTRPQRLVEILAERNGEPASRHELAKILRITSSAIGKVVFDARKLAPIVAERGKGYWIERKA